MARSTITQDKIIEINELYLEIGTYAGVSRALGGSPSPTTIKKYIIPNYVSKINIQKKTFYKNELPENPTILFNKIKNWGDLCNLSINEKQEIVELWNEMLL